MWSGIGIGAAVGIVLFSFAGYAAYNCICTRKPSNTETDFAAVDMNVQVGLGPRNQQGSNNVSETLVLDRNRLIWEKKNEKINLMLRPDLKATHLEIQAMDAGALGIRPSQIPKRIFFKRLLSRFSTLFKRHLEDADETSCFFAHPKDCAKSGYSRRERAAIMIHVVFVAILSEQVIAQLFEDPCPSKDPDIVYQISLTALELLAGGLVQQVIKCILLTPLIKKVFSLHANEGTTCAFVAKWFATVVCGLLWIVESLILILVTILAFTVGTELPGISSVGSITWKFVVMFYLGSLNAFLQNYCVYAPINFLLVSRWAEVHPPTEPLTYAPRHLSCLSRSTWKWLSALMIAPWAASDDVNGYPLLSTTPFWSQENLTHHRFYFTLTIWTDHPQDFWGLSTTKTTCTVPRCCLCCPCLIVFCPLIDSCFISSVSPSEVEALPEGWCEVVDSQGRTYYQNNLTHETFWQRPTSCLSIDAMRSIRQMTYESPLSLTMTPDEMGGELAQRLPVAAIEPTPAASAQTVSEKDLSDLLRTFYAIHAPERVARAGEIAAKYFHAGYANGAMPTLNFALQSTYNADLTDISAANQDSSEVGRERVEVGASVVGGGSAAAGDARVGDGLRFVMSGWVKKNSSLTAIEVCLRLPFPFPLHHSARFCRLPPREEGAPPPRPPPSPLLLSSSRPPRILV